jgi:putative GTP pyrophosphokinase
MKKDNFPNKNSLRAEHDKYLHERALIAKELEVLIEDALLPMTSRPRVKSRMKSFESYFKKYIRLLKSGTSDNALLIADVIGIRIICPFLEDLAAVEELLKEKFKVVEVERKGGDHTFREFGYESVHLLIAVPKSILKKRKIPGGETAEIQIRTLLQDAWAEVEHELVYKAEFAPFDNSRKRKLAAVNASLVLADVIFQEIRSYQRGLHWELDKRRDSFFRKIEETTDHAILTAENHPPIEKSMEEPSVLRHYWTPVEVGGSVSIDDLLVEALTAHNKNQFPEAIAIYTQILNMNLDDNIRSLIYKHRGMAFFARSNYEEAIADFSESMKLDPTSYKTAYYEGVVCSVVGRYSQAVSAFNRSLEIHPYQPYCLFRRGQVYYHLEDFPHALGDCEAALALESFPAAENFRAMLLSKLKM